METTTPKQPHYMLQFFRYEHLTAANLRAASQPFGELAKLVDETLPDNPEKTECLRKLMEAKDSAVRAVLFQK